MASDPPPPYTPPTLDRGPAQPRRPSSTYSQSSDTIPVRPPQPNRQTSSEPSDQTAAPPTYQSVVRTVSNTEEGGANTDSALDYSQTVTSHTENDRLVQTSSVQVRRGSGTPVIEVTQVNEHHIPTVEDNVGTDNSNSLPSSSSSDRLCPSNEGTISSGVQQVTLTFCWFLECTIIACISL